ncbi:hypothetical protein POJ06DRAFT_77105 [Lipomyces tetrasporus]|uniref:HTH La-type RNA-binding domain-containing protein n=1 Tax=Lipomyces tetrasporus TaxID=54092 RepID=A0AAD7VVE0_9ASCO|nr:uncharacterized protein POJ06DRAFT_77105 [Lipomyces tetrasporus]KAJ8102115.1 hypothetical protein POJ06DRAFT_77105 [Lipomyces tetrasporus]
MPSASTVTAPSYALAAGAKPATNRASSSASKDDSPSIQGSAISSTVSTVAKDAPSLSSVAESPSSTPSPEEPLTNGKPTDVSNKDKDGTSTSNTVEVSSSSSNGSAGVSSSSSSSTTSNATESVSSVEATAAVSQKPNLTPAPLPSVNVWKVRQETIPARSVPSSSVDPTPAELSAAASNGDKERKSSKSATVADLDSKDWPIAPEEENIAEKKENASKSAKRQGKEKWVPYTPALIVPAKSSNRNSKPFSSRSNNSGRSGSVGNTEGSNSGEEHNGRGKNFVRGNRQKNGSSLNGTTDKKPASSSSASNSTENRDKDPKTWQKKHHEKKDPVKDEKDDDVSKDRSTRSASKDLSQSTSDGANDTAAAQSSEDQPQEQPSNMPNYHASHLPSHNQALVSSSQGSAQSGSEQPSAPINQGSSYHQQHQSHHSHSNQFSQAPASHPQSKAVPLNKNRTQRPYGHTNGTHQPNGHGSQPINRGPRNSDYHNGHGTSNGQSPISQSGQPAPYQNSRTTPNGTRNSSPRSIHSNPQFQQQHFSGYQPHHSSHHSNYNPIRRASAVSVPAFQPAARQFYAPQQDYAAMFAFSQAFPPQPALIPGYIYEPANPVTAQVDYYFSLENLCKDIYLRRNMNSAGLVPLSLLAGFNRIKSLISGDINILTEACRQSHNAEVVGNKVRSREHWSNFVMPFNERLPPGQEEEAESSSTPSSMPVSLKDSPATAAVSTVTTQELPASAPVVITQAPVPAAAAE